MDNLLEPAVANTIIQRTEQLRPDTPAQWGKMSVSQMLAHCQVPIECALGDRIQKQSFFGKLFGRMAKKQMLNDTPIKKNLPTDPSFLVKDDRNFEKEKQLLQTLVKRFAGSDSEVLAQTIHPFFGRLSGNELGMLTWKHLDHHLRQFGV